MSMVVLAALSASAHAALPPEYYSNARAEAAHHLQLRIDAVTLEPGAGSANCEVRGRVLRDFRGEAAAGTPLAFTLNCLAPGVSPMPGASSWHDYAQLKTARFAEGFFDGVESGPVYGQLGIVEAERASPWCEAESGRCDLPPAAPPRVLECRPDDAAAGPGWRVKIDNARMWYWVDAAAGAGSTGLAPEQQAPGWRRSIWPIGRTQEPLVVEPQRYLHRTALFSEGGERLLEVRQLTIDRTTLAFEDQYMAVDGPERAPTRGTCVETADPEGTAPVAGAAGG